MKTQSLISILTLLVSGLTSPNSFAARPIFLTAGLYSTGQNPAAATVQDFNNDGEADIATANTGDTYPTGQIPESVVAADFDGHGNLDLAVWQ